MLGADEEFSVGIAVLEVTAAQARVVMVGAIAAVTEVLAGRGVEELKVKMLFCYLS